MLVVLDTWNNMLQPLDPRILSALVRDDDDADSIFIPQARFRLNEDRNLSLGVQLLLELYGRFKAQLYQDKAPNDDNRKGAERWHIRFRGDLFSNLRICSTSVEGVIDIHVLNKPFLSIWIFDRPQNWQSMLKWLWEYGDKCQIARSIPQLDPRRMSALINGKDRSNRCNQMDGGGFVGRDVEDDDGLLYLPTCAVRRAFATKGSGQGVYELLLAFRIFEPDLYWDKPSIWHADVGYEEWHISFLNSPFRSLRLQPGTLKGVVDIYAFNKLVKSFQMTDSSESWQAFLEWLWDYGNKRYIAKAEYEASHPQRKSKAKSQSKQQRAQKSLLHQVLHSTSFKAQRGPKVTPKELKNIPEEADVVLNEVDERMPMQRPALQPADPNGQIGQSGQSRSTMADHAAKVLR